MGKSSNNVIDEVYGWENHLEELGISRLCLIAVFLVNWWIWEDCNWENHPTHCNWLLTLVEKPPKWDYTISNWIILPSGYVKIAIENGPFIVDLPIKNGDVP